MMQVTDLFPREASVRQCVVVPVSAEAAWNAIGQLDSMVPAGDLVERVELDGTGEGAIRTYHLVIGGTVVERIEHYDPAERLYVYRILNAGPLPMRRYLGMAQVLPEASGHCRIAWHAMADSLDGETAALTAMLEGSVAQALGAFAAHLAGGDGAR